jgi:hypothetical protein
MNTLIKWIAVAVLLGGTYFVVKNYNIIASPVAAQEACIGVEEVTKIISQNIETYEAASKTDVDWKMTLYSDVVADNFLTNILKLEGYDEASIKQGVEKVGDVAIYSASITDTSLIVMFDNNGCKLGQVEVPSAEIAAFSAEAGV